MTPPTLSQIFYSWITVFEDLDSESEDEKVSFRQESLFPKA